MLFLFFTTVFTSIICCVRGACHACFGDVCYLKKKVFEAKEISGQIAIDRPDDILYFHYKGHRSEDFTAALDLRQDYNQRPFKMPVDFSHGRALNSDTGELYFSGSRGIYIFNSVTKMTDQYTMFNETIWHMQYKERLYFTIYKADGIHYFVGSRTKTIPASSNFIVDDFIIDKYEDIYFICDRILYRIKKNKPRAHIFSNMHFNLFTDKYENAYFIDQITRSLYKMDYVKDRLYEVGVFERGNITSAVYDASDNLIYCDANSGSYILYRLTPNYGKCAVVMKKRVHK